MEEIRKNLKRTNRLIIVLALILVVAIIIMMNLLL